MRETSSTLVAGTHPIERRPQVLRALFDRLTAWPGRPSLSSTGKQIMHTACQSGAEAVVQPENATASARHGESATRG